MESLWYSQSPYRYRMDWGRRGVRNAVARGDIVVIVDTLRFSTAVATAVAAGGVIYPSLESDDAAAIARRHGAVVAGRAVGGQDRYSLSPLSYENMPAGARVVLKSPNGATCCRYAAQAPAVYTGALVNASSLANQIALSAQTAGASVTVIACGERWSATSEDGAIRHAIEDYLGAGGILSYLPDADKSPEAWLCAAAFRQVSSHLSEVLWECGSGRELRDKGCADDVRHAGRLNVYDCAPRLRDSRFEHE